MVFLEFNIMKRKFRINEKSKVRYGKQLKAAMQQGQKNPNKMKLVVIQDTGGQLLMGTWQRDIRKNVLKIYVKPFQKL